jgi:hypothetical protein
MGDWCYSFIRFFRIGGLAMQNLERLELLWDYLTDTEFGEYCFVYNDEIEKGEAYLDMETEEIVLNFEGKPCRIIIEGLE